MQFLVYIVVMLVALGSVLIELDWLTSPKLEPRAAQTASVAAPAPGGRVVGPNAELSPVYRTAQAPQVEPPAPAPQAEQPAATAPPAAAPAAAVASTPQAVPPADTANNSKGVAETTGAGGPLTSTFSTANSQQSTASFQPVAPPPPAMPEAKPATLQVPNRCDVQACAGKYQSFRASDCTYQPTEGARKLCLSPSGSGQKTVAAARNNNRDKEAELRAVERKVREITGPSDTGRSLAYDDDDLDAAMAGGRRVIVIRRGGPRW